MLNIWEWQFHNLFGSLCQMLINILRIAQLSVSPSPPFFSCCNTFVALSSPCSLLKWTWLLPFLWHIRQWERTDLPTAFSVFRDTALTLSHGGLCCSPLTTLLHGVQSASVRLVPQSPRIGTELQVHSQNTKQMEIIIFCDLLAMTLLTYNLQLAFVAGRMHCYLTLSISLSRTPRLFPTVGSSQSVLSLSCRGLSRLKSRTSHLFVFHGRNSIFSRALVLPSKLPTKILHGNRFPALMSSL